MFPGNGYAIGVHSWSPTLAAPCLRLSSLDPDVRCLTDTFLARRLAMSSPDHNCAFAPYISPAATGVFAQAASDSAEL